MIGLFEIEVNGSRIVSFGSKEGPSKEISWVIVGFRLPNVNLPFHRQNHLGEWERMLGISFPTTFQIGYIDDISWEFHLRVLGFGIAFCHQYGY